MITGFVVFECPFCKAKQADLHLRTKAPCFVRCGRCGAHGPNSTSPKEAVIRWGGYSTEEENTGNTGR